MPFRDSTGPRGMGPMTGHGGGYCSDAARRDFGMRAGRPFGRGFRRVHPGRGMGHGFGYFNPGQPSQDIGTSEIDALKNEALGMSERLDAIRQRIDELEKHD